MCGFAAIIMKRGVPADAGPIVAMCDVIRHRGPDDAGVLIDGSVGLGSRRLSIIDLSPAGHMPMESADGQLAIAYNGEVYNHRELRAELESLGHAFRSRTDTEVILAAYAQWGEECLQRFNGMWGFAILDRRRRVLFCARDRFGIKPVHWVDLPDRVAISSEIKQLLPMMPVRHASRSLLVDHIMSSATDCDPQRTFFGGVQKLPASHCMTIELDSLRCSVRRWYEVPRLDLGTTPMAELTEEFARRFTRSIELRLRSDVVVGTCLSGGLDSSVIAAFASAAHRRQAGVAPFKAVTALSVDPRLDESSYASAVVRHCGLDWVRTKPTREDFIAHLGSVIRAQEEPFPTPSMIMQYFVMKAAREAGITVLLDGQGGDELLLGYPMHRGAHLAWLAKHRGPLAASIEYVRLLRSGTVPALTLLKYAIGNMSRNQRIALYRRRHSYLREIPASLPSLDWLADGIPEVRSRQLEDIFRMVLPQLLRFEDRNSMAWSIESRLPFLDFSVVEFCVSLPIHAKLHGGWSKHLLRTVAAQHLPAEIAWRRSKFGFEAPDAAWLGPHSATMLEAVRASPILGELIDPGALARAWGGLDLRSRWRLYCIALWETTHGITGLSD